METFEMRITKTPGNKSRKRQRNPDGNKRNQRKNLLYGAKNLPEASKCKHKNYLECGSLKMCDLKAFHDLFYKKKQKVYQDTLIYKYCSVELPKRSRIRDNTRGKKSLTIKYSIRKLDGKVAKVCRSMFLNILDIKKDRIQGVMRRFHTKGTPPKEGRGGDRIKNKNDNKKKRNISFHRKPDMC